MKVTKIHSEADLDTALERIGELLRSEEGTPEFEELQALTDLVIAYEAIHYPIPDPSPADWIQGRLDALGLSEDDLATHLGSTEIVAGILAGELDITAELAESLHQYLGISLEDLLPEATPSHG